MRTFSSQADFYLLMAFVPCSRRDPACVFVMESSKLEFSAGSTVYTRTRSNKQLVCSYEFLSFISA